VRNLSFFLSFFLFYQDWRKNLQTISRSCSDMTVKLWDLDHPQDPLVDSFTHHTEFVVGVDFNIFVNYQIASCSWDGTVVVFGV
jgi:peroxin-7